MIPTNAFFIQGKDRSANIIILCDHASNYVPSQINNGSLGLNENDMNRHIAYDIGAAGVSKHLGEILNAPVVLSNFSRLVIDPNRGEDDPTLLMRLYDGTLIPANRKADEAEKKRRLTLWYHPYNNALSDVISNKETPIIISIHSFTPQLKGRSKRPWEIGILFSDDERLSRPLIISLCDQGLTVGVNQPYNGKLQGDTLDRHALAFGHLHVLIELRNDLITTEIDQQKWANRLAPHINKAIIKAQIKQEITNG